MGFELSYSLQFGRPLTQGRPDARAPGAPGRAKAGGRARRRTAGRSRPPDRIRARGAAQDDGDPARRGPAVRRGSPREIGRPRAVRAVGIGARPTTRSRSSSPATASCAPTATSASTARAAPRPSARCSRSRGSTRTSSSGSRRRDPLLRVGHDEDLLLPVVPARSAGHAAAPDEVPLGRRRARGRISRLQGLPAVGKCGVRRVAACRPPRRTPTGAARSVDDRVMPGRYHSPVGAAERTAFLRALGSRKSAFARCLMTPRHRFDAEVRLTGRMTTSRHKAGQIPVRRVDRTRPGPMSAAPPPRRRCRRAR